MILIDIINSIKLYQEGHDQKSSRIVAIDLYSNISNKILIHLESELGLLY